MTKHIVIANLSNWDGEDFEIEIERPVQGGTDVETVKYELLPGEYADVCSGKDATVRIVDKNRKEVNPFIVKGDKKRIAQTWPEMSINWRSFRGHASAE